MKTNIFFLFLFLGTIVHGIEDDFQFFKPRSPYQSSHQAAVDNGHALFDIIVDEVSKSQFNDQVWAKNINQIIPNSAIPCDFNVQNPEGKTLLMFFARMGYVESAEALVRCHHVNKALTDSQGRTAADLAYYSGNFFLSQSRLEFLCGGSEIGEKRRNRAKQILVGCLTIGVVATFGLSLLNGSSGSNNNSSKAKPSLPELDSLSQDVKKALGIYLTTFAELKQDPTLFSAEVRKLKEAALYHKEMSDFLKFVLDKLNSLPQNGTASPA
jgi:hypothetical protein